MKEAKEKEHIPFFHEQTSSSIRLVIREKEKIHTELRNSRIDHQLVQSYSHASDHLFVVLLFTVRDENTRSRECDKNTMVIHSLGSNYIYIYIYTYTHAQAKKDIN